MSKKGKFKPGDIVTIYSDPFTSEKIEGQAKLVKCLDNDPEMNRWTVRFLSDERDVDRFILPTA